MRIFKRIEIHILIIRNIWTKSPHSVREFDFNINLLLSPFNALRLNPHDGAGLWATMTNCASVVTRSVMP